MKLDFIDWTKAHSDELSDAAAILVALGVMVWIINPSLIDYFFSTGGKGVHHFQWVGVSTIIAVIGFGYNQAWERKKFNADLKSKSRMAWMKTVRDLMGEYVSAGPASVNKLANYYVWTFVQGGGPDNMNSALEKREEYNASVERANTLLLTMTLYIPHQDGDGNDVINQAIDETAEQLQKSTQAIETVGQKLLPLLMNKQITLIQAKFQLDAVVNLEKNRVRESTDVLISVGRDYFSDIWHDAKEGK